MKFGNLLKIVLICGGGPVPAVKGGAVECLTEWLLDKNEHDPRFQFIVVSPACKELEVQVKRYKFCNFIFIDTEGFGYILSRNIRYAFHRFFKNSYLGNAFIAAAIRRLKRHKFDKIIIQNTPQFSIVLKKAFPEIPVWLYLHNHYIYPGCVYEKKILGSVDRFICVSNFICNEIIKTGVDENKVFCCYNGVDSKRFSGKISDEKRAEIRRKMGIGDDDFVYIFWGRVVPQKGVYETIAAFYEVEKKVVNAKLLVLGSRGFKDGEMVLDKGTESVIFSGFVPYDQIPEYISVGDVAVLPSMCNEAFGMTVLEACNAGMPLICTNAGGILEVVGETGCAVIVDWKKDVQKQLEREMVNLYYSRERRIELSMRAKARGQFFSIQRYWERFCELVG